MPSPRRMRLLAAAALVTVLFILFYTSGLEPEHDVGLKDFYERTKEAMERGASRGQAVLNSKTGKKVGHIPADKDGDGDVDEDDKVVAQELQQRLQAVALEAKNKANEKAGPKPDAPSKIIGVGSSAEGQARKGSVVKAGGGDADADVAKEKADAKAKTEKEGRKGEQEAEMELDSILKKSPVIIFSKTYCPYSKRAKGILLEKYAITPEPYVVELDEHPLGPHLQDCLSAKTGRRTVPNIMVNGVSIGGSDEIVQLDNDNKLLAKIRDLGQARVEITERFTTNSHR